MTSQVLRISVRRHADAADYEGVLRRGRALLWSCGHHHHNRDQSSGINGTAAAPCVDMRVRAARNPALVAAYGTDTLANAARAQRILGGRAADARHMLAQADFAAEAFKRQVAEVAALIGDEPVYGKADSLVVAPPAPTGRCPVCGVEVIATRWAGPTPPTTDWNERNKRPWEPWGRWRPLNYFTTATPARCTGDSLDHLAPEGGATS